MILLKCRKAFNLPKSRKGRVQWLYVGIAFNSFSCDIKLKYNGWSYLDKITYEYLGKYCKRGSVGFC